MHLPSGFVDRALAIRQSDGNVSSLRVRPRGELESVRPARFRPQYVSCLPWQSSETGNLVRRRLC
eukprot:3601732-Pleurochrysis_carterae.AAC.1